MDSAWPGNVKEQCIMHIAHIVITFLYPCINLVLCGRCSHISFQYAGRKWLRFLKLCSNQYIHKCWLYVRPILNNWHIYLIYWIFCYMTKRLFILWSIQLPGKFYRRRSNHCKGEHCWGEGSSRSKAFRWTVITVCFIGVPTRYSHALGLNGTSAVLLCSYCDMEVSALCMLLI